MFWKSNQDASEESLPAAAEGASDDSRAIVQAFGRAQAMITFTPEGTILDANEIFLATLGYTLAEVRGQHHKIFCDPEYVASNEYRDFWYSLRRGEYHTSEFKRFSKSGDKIWISASYNPIFNDAGEVVKIVKIATDITETKHAADEQHAKINAIGRALAMIEFTPDGVILDANENFLQTLGYRLEEIRGNHHRMFCDEQYAKTNEYRAFWHKLRGGSFVSDRFLRFAKDKTPVWIQASYNPVCDDEGRVVKVVKIAFDITDQHRTRQKAKEVGQLIATSTTQMASTIEDISASVSRTATLAGQAEDFARSSSGTTQALQDSSKAIGEVVGVIQELADQTNLLALNATIEAARAGESGRSFAVVANEVKDLASETSSATRSIEESVAEIQSRITEVSESISKIDKSVSEVSSNTNSVASAIEEQSVTMSELSQTADSLVGLAN